MNTQFNGETEFIQAVENAEYYVSKYGFHLLGHDGVFSALFELEDLLLYIFFIKANNGDNYCYFAKLTSKLSKLTIGMPIGRYNRQVQWRMNMYNLIKDIKEMIDKIHSVSKNGSMKAKIYYWNKEKGFGFAKSKAYERIFIHISKLPSYLSNVELKGVNITVITESTDKGMRAVYVE